VYASRSKPVRRLVAFLIVLACGVGVGVSVGCGAFLGLNDDDDNANSPPASDAGADGANSGNESDSGGVLNDGDVPLATYKDEVLRDGPIAYWRFEEKEGHDVVDETTSHPGDLLADDADAGDDSAFARLPGLAGGEGALSLAQAFAVVKDSKGLSFENTTAFTMELWLQVSILKGAPKQVAGHFSGSSSAGYRLVTDTLLRFERVAGLPMQSTSISHAFDLIALSRSHHVVATYDGNTLSLYVDGNVSGTATSNQRLTLDDGTPFTMGGLSDGGDRFGGVIDELALYNRALPLDRIKAHLDARSRK
jgi:hypothetical protein